MSATQERMLREMAQALEELTAEQPLVLWLEDLHGSDYATLDLLAFLARRREPARLLVIGTYRPLAVRSGEHPLAAIKQELQVRGQCQELALEPLGEGAVAEYLETRLPGSQLPAGLARMIHQRTEGNPLFMVGVVETLLGQEAGNHGAEPGALQRVIEAVSKTVPASIRQIHRATGGAGQARGARGAGGCQCGGRGMLCGGHCCGAGRGGGGGREVL